jgi:uncharacterized repeat protein (TIGR04138 family)
MSSEEERKDEEAPSEEAPSEGMGPLIVFEAAVDLIRERDPRFAPEAFHFVREALDWEVSRLPERRHISGPELLGAVGQLAVERFGPMARTVLNHWGLSAGEDVGQIVFLLVEAGILSKTDEDSIEDFSGVVRFDDAFESGYRWP